MLSELKKLLKDSFVIDNKRILLGDAVREFLKESVSARMAIGYIFIDGFRAIAGAFGHLDSLQILIGHKTNLETKAILSILHKKPEGFWGKFLNLFRKKKEKSLEEEIQDLLKELSDLDIQSLYDLIRTKRAQFKIYHLPDAYFHSKLYLFDMPIGITGKSKETIAILGSSNFSMAGFQTNIELNVYVSDVEKTKKLNDWFQERWAEAKEFDPMLIEVVEREFRRRKRMPKPLSELVLILPETVFVNQPARFILKPKNLVQVSLETSDLQENIETVKTVAIQDEAEVVIEAIFNRTGTVFVRGVGKDSLGRTIYTSWQSIVIEKVPVIEKEFTPYDFYLVTLYKYFEPHIERILKDLTLFPEEEKAKPLKPWQSDAIDTVWETVKRFGGGILADSVGLGKTKIAVVIIRKFLEEYLDKNVLVILPTVLEDTVWKKELKNEGLGNDSRIKFQHLEVMGRETFNPAQYREVGLIIIDEAHLFRNPNTGRYKALSEILANNRGSKLLFVTATPINNTVNDLKSLFMFFLSETSFTTTGIYNLWQIFKDFQDEEESIRTEARTKLDCVLNQVVVKRTRRFLEKEYGFREFPSRILQREDYNLTEPMCEVLNSLETALDKLLFPQYQLRKYKVSISEEEAEELKQGQFVIHFVESLFVKRFESSLAAFENTIDRQKKILRSLEGFLANFAGREREDVIKQVGFFIEDDESLAGLTKKIKEDLEDIVQNVAGYNIDRLKADIESDLNLIEELYDKAVTAKQEESKLPKLFSILENGLKGKKVLIFTQYIDTAKYIYEYLRRQYGATVGILTGNEPDKEQLIARFAPEANNIRHEFLKMKGEIQYLVATDVLSMGLNLQDAHHLISYDLPWNPIVLLQRQGRIDRLGQKQKEVFIINFFPPEGINKIIGLLEKIRRKLIDIAETVGKEEIVLEPEEIINPREFQAKILNRIAQNDSTLLEDLEEKSDEVYQNLTDFLRMRIKKEIKDPKVLNRMRTVARMLPKTTRLPFLNNREEYLLLMKINEKVEIWLFNGTQILRDDRRIITLLVKSQESKEQLEMPDLSAVVKSAEDSFREEIRRAQMAGEPSGRILGQIKTRLQGIYIQKKNLINDAEENRRLLDQKIVTGLDERRLKVIYREKDDKTFLADLRKLLLSCPEKPKQPYPSLEEVKFLAGMAIK